MCAISALGCSDLLSPEQIFAVTRQRLQHLSQGSPGPVANRATKVTLGTSLCPVPGVGAPGTGLTARGDTQLLGMALSQSMALAAFPRSRNLAEVMLPGSPGRGQWGQSLCLGEGARARSLC